MCVFIYIYIYIHVTCFYVKILSIFCTLYVHHYNVRAIICLKIFGSFFVMETQWAFREV